MIYFSSANSTFFILRISSSVFPENMDPQITSILPLKICLLSMLVLFIEIHCKVVNFKD